MRSKKPAVFGRGVERSGLRGAAVGEACGFFFRETKGVQEVKSKEVLSGQTAGGFARGQSMRATARAFRDLRQREVEINAWNAVCTNSFQWLWRSRPDLGSCCHHELVELKADLYLTNTYVHACARHSSDAV